MDEKRQGMLWAAFAADALALGAHWIYDPKAIQERFGRLERYVTPGPNSYHPGKSAGDFTHYGDQMLVLLESVAACRARFDLQDFASRWRKLFANYTGYVDKATKGTLQRFAEGYGPEASGSASTDLAGAARIGPILYAMPDDPQACVAAARAQTAMTHNNAMVVEAAAYWTVVTQEVLVGKHPQDALESALQKLSLPELFASWVRHGLESASMETEAAVLDFGQSCAVDGALPSVVHCIARYAEDLREGLIQNVMVGGDSAGRGLLVGMVLGAHHGLRAIPQEWIEALRAGPKIRTLMEQIDGARIQETLRS
ncbi:ADP-ribosylglycohydrolase family protein [Desulfosoma caldarium]|uniref:ADP-ribosylglycohydrolase n=1 Tax=Desulfosoma caldarium TaxID=610254 RepID=A0A3N1UUW0_9BACT|nr:ADP-ribosylglycohydrolase family protein [Desulfosoma caldarium]ROQ92327.1 ADP-ribosylglycohydrolase [Desulfosoma caldarium]